MKKSFVVTAFAALFSLVASLAFAAAMEGKMGDKPVKIDEHKVMWIDGAMAPAGDHMVMIDGKEVKVTVKGDKGEASW